MEKTFEELMHEYTVKLDGVTTYYLQPRTVLKLMQLVREATIAECEQIAFDNLDFHSCEDVRNDLYNMDIDRIKITDEKA